MIAVNQVSKFFGSVVAVSEVSFAIEAGVTALLGPNGAGKSTLFRMLCGLTPPSRGSVEVLGSDPRRDRNVRGRVSLVPQQDALFDHLSASSFLEFAARTHGVSDPTHAAAEALAKVELADVGAKPVGQFSKGMRQRVKVAAALVNDPEVLILDEPLTGLDPVQRRHMISLFHDLGDDGRCVLVSSHVLDEVAKLGSRVLVIAQGRLIATGDYRDLRELMTQLLGCYLADYRVGQMTYDLRRLRLKGILYRPPGTHRYFITPYGWKVARLFSRLEGRVLRPAMAMFTANDAVLPFPLRQSLDRVDAQMDQLIYQAFPPPEKAA